MIEEIENVRNMVIKLINKNGPGQIYDIEYSSPYFSTTENKHFIKFSYLNTYMMVIEFWKSNTFEKEAEQIAISLSGNGDHKTLRDFHNQMSKINNKLPERKKMTEIRDLELLIEEVFIIYA